VPFMVEAVRSKLLRIQKRNEELNVELQAVEEELDCRNLDWRKALLARFRFSDDLFWRSVSLKHSVDDTKDQIDAASKWLRFLSAMPSHRMLNLDDDDFAYFFPGDTYANMTK